MRASRAASPQNKRGRWRALLDRLSVLLAGNRSGLQQLAIIADISGTFEDWRPQRESNPCFQDENLMS